MHMPAPATQGGLKPGKFTKTPLKRDINLISNKDSQEKIARRGLYLIAFLVAAAGFAYFAIYQPLLQTDALNAKLQDVNKQLVAYSTTEAEFTDLTGRLKMVKQLLDLVNNSETAAKSAYDITQMVEKACPESIELKMLSYSINEVKIGGQAVSDQDVAQLLSNLQSYPDFVTVMATSVTTLPPQKVPTNKKRMFQIVAYFPSSLSAAPTETPAPAPTSSNGGSGK